jgi:hypothetical protein
MLTRPSGAGRGAINLSVKSSGQSRVSMMGRGAAAQREVGPPTAAELHAALGKSTSAWPQILSGLEELAGPLTLEWHPSSLAFGRLCLVRGGGRVLVYLMPMAGQLLVGVVVNTVAYYLAQGSELRPAIKQMLAETRPTAEGRGIRFVVKTEADIAEVVTLARCVLTAAKEEARGG